jgi:hypothetical protein
MNPLGRSLMIMGLILVLIGAVIALGSKLGLGRLPGDIAIERKGFSFHFPIATSIIVSVVLTLLANLFWRRR